MTYCIYYRPSDLAIEIDQVLDRCYKQSRAVDTESLCIVAGEKVEDSLMHQLAKVHDISSVTMHWHSNNLAYAEVLMSQGRSLGPHRFGKSV